MSSSSGLKRKRGSSASYPIIISSAGRRPYGKAYTKKRKMFIPGVDRTGGFYGRYAGRDGELKFHDVTFTVATVGATASLKDSFNLIPQGITEDERIGRKCALRSFTIKYTYGLPIRDAVALPIDGDVMRIIFYMDKQTNGATATSANILKSDFWMSFRNLAESQRFVILMDKVVTANYMGLGSDNAGVVSQSEVVKHGSFYKKCNIPIEFSGVTGAITEIRSNNIGCLVISKNGVMSFDSRARVRFSDG